MTNPLKTHIIAQWLLSFLLKFKDKSNGNFKIAGIIN